VSYIFLKIKSNFVLAIPTLKNIKELKVYRKKRHNNFVSAYDMRRLKIK